MNRKNSDDERPSIIQEIVFYDKPNRKAVVPEAILSKSTVPVGKGDIVISRVRKVSVPQKSTEKHQSDETKEKTNFLESAEKDSIKTLKEHGQSKALSSIESLNHFISYENLEEESLEPQDTFESSRSSVETETTDNKQQEANHSSKTIDIPNVDKKPTQLDKSSGSSRKSTGKEETPTESKKTKKMTNINKKSAKVTKKAIPTKVKESPFKTPHRPVTKSEKKSSQKVTMLNYLTKKSKDKEKKDLSEQKIIVAEVVSIKGPRVRSDTEKTSLEKSPNEKIKKKSDRVEKSDVKEGIAKNTVKAKQIQSSPKKKGTEPKRPRGRPRKTSGKEIHIVKTDSCYSDEDISFRSPEKSKNYAELTNVPLSSNQSSSTAEVVLNPDDLEEILGEAQEHAKELERMEKDLQNMFGTGQEGENKQTGKGKRKALGRKVKTSEEVIKKVKKEVEEGGEEESGGDPVDDTVAVDNYDSDEDSRSEWIPREYAEYKQQHVMRHQSKRFPCKFCGQHFRSYYGMRKHRALEHNDVGKDRKEGSYKESVKCKQEKEQDESDEESREEWLPQDYADYKLKHKMTQYQMKRVQWYKCKICCAVFSNYYKLSKHRVEHENKPNPYECKQCDGRFRDVETLMAHIRVHQGKDPYQCRKCEKGFMTKAELDEHVPVHILKKGPTPPKRFRCDICSKEFSKLCDIERHTRVHTGEKPAECNICHKRFQQSHNLSKHLLTHLHVRPFQCEICNKKFGRIDVLNRHLLTHSMEKPFKCEICSKGFIRQVQVTNHMEKVHTSKRQLTSEIIISEDNGDDDMADDQFEESADGII